MTQVVEGAGGTARRSQNKNYRIAGKTGTAQVFTVGQNQSYKSLNVPKNLRDHALFIAFAPVNDPQIAIAVYVEYAGFGGTWAAPIASLMVEKYLNGEITNHQKEQRILDFENLYITKTIK
jgi:penicillin-binding protein 2